MTKNENVRFCSRENERELITMAKSGDKLAFEKLLLCYTNYVGYIVDTICWSLGEYREDLMQEGFMALFRAVRTYDGSSSSFSTYAFQCIKNSVITAKRKLERETVSTEMEDIGAPSAEETVLDSESTRLLYEKMIERLSKSEREIMELYIDGMRSTEIAKLLGKTNKSVDNALSRAKRKLAST